MKGANQFIGAARVIEVVLPAEAGGVRKGRGLDPGLTDDVAEPVGPGAGGVADGSPDRPQVGRWADRELLGRHGADDLAQLAVVLGPHVVSGANRRNTHGANDTRAFGPHQLTDGSYNRMVVWMQTLLDFDHAFGALADATRRDIVRRAIDGNEGIAELADHYPMSFAAVQKHVAILERAGLVTKQRIGRRKVVRTNVAGLRMARGLLDQYEQLWRDRIERMTDLINETIEETTG